MATIKVPAALTRAREIGAKIKTKDQANDAIKLVLRLLRNTINVVGDFSFEDKAVGVQKAWQDRIAGQIRRVRVLQKRLRQGANRTQLADAIGLSIVQASKLLKDLAAAVIKSNSNILQRLLNDFAKAVVEVLEAVGKAILGALPWYVYAIGAYLLIRK